MTISCHLPKISRFRKQRWICAGLLLYLSVLPYLAENLHVEVQSVKAQVGEDVLLPCHITGYGASELELQKVGVGWLFITLNGTEEDLYSFNGQVHRPRRNGSRVSEEELQKGNASLLIPQVRIAEEGSYKCVVVMTPNRAEGMLYLTVSANPKVALSSSEITVEAGTEKSVMCLVNQFYPSSIQVRWFEISGNRENEVTTGICTGSLADNIDGTFNVISRLRLKASLKDHEKKYACSVEHRTLINNIFLTATLHVTEHKTQIAIIIFSVIGSLLVTSLLFGVASLIYVKYFRKVPPTMTITIPQKLIHLEKAVFSCQITGFKPKDITVEFCLETKDNRRKYISTWSSSEINSKVKPQDMDCEEQVSLFLTEGGTSRLDSYFEVEPPMIQSHNDKTFSITCNIVAIFDMYRHDGAKLSIKVHHTALLHPATECVVFSVEGVPPRLSKILAPHRVVHQEFCMLTCPISCFKPRPLSISWFKKQSEGEEEELVAVVSMHEAFTHDAVEEVPGYTPSISDAVQLEDKSYCVTAMLLFIPTALEHQNCLFISEVSHEATKTKTRMETWLQVSAMPILEPIDSFPNTPKSDESVTLSCRIHSFFPQKIEIFWCKDGILMSEKPENTESTADQIGLYYCISKITFMPSRMDRGKTISCQIKHESSMDPRCVEWNMMTLMVSPRISEITSDSPVLEQEKTVTLKCQIEDYYPEGCIVQWNKEIGVIKMENPTLNPKTGLYSSQTTMAFAPTMDDHGTEIVVEILHYATMVQSIQKTFQLFLKGVPVVLDIVCNPEVAGYGKPFTLICAVSGFHPENIIVDWYRDNMKMTDGITTTDVEQDSRGLFSLRSALRLVPTALDFNRSICFHVNHPRLQQPIIKRSTICLAGVSTNVPNQISESDDVPPHLQEDSGSVQMLPIDGEMGGVQIQCVTTSPKAGEKVTLKCNFLDYDLNKTELKWYKGIYPLHNAKVEKKTCKDGFVSYVTFQTDREDRECRIRCEITTDGGGQEMDVCYVLKLT
ncbi:uncharacterized protein LOC115468917 isoform X2 [Microcaecilia unicolor]|uniref:Uncharacterized protein LOC115468917 isoform X2 n=1 Tax=Microcaecilia unicolor TaxID=1415580 RepID=A0A6P7XVD1_9AMPH|nr:uncharacterized protein LOC115468917 isoform X2 [Microcaecilia unicolor]